MSHLSKVFNKVPVKVQDRSGFDLSHENLFSAKVGTLIPASVEEVMPGDVVSIGCAMSVELPPLATNFKGRVDARLEAFFVPNRILWAGWQDFIVQDRNHKPSVPGFTVATQVPRIQISQTYGGPGSLADYLGIKSYVGAGGATPDFNILPFLAYAKIWDDWYRDSNIQNPFFIDGIDGGAENSAIAASKFPYLRSSGLVNSTTNYSQAGSLMGFNGHDLRTLYQRNFAKDYYTTMTTQPQSGADAELEFSVDTSTGDGSFSIASLRAANSLQVWLERNNISGTRYYDQILAHYGVVPSDAAFQRPLLLGATTCPVIVNSVNQTAQGTNSQTKNPYANSTGAKFGSGNAFGEGRLVNKFEVKEHGYIMVIFSLVPHAYYGTGIRRYINQRYYSGDFAFPEFANIGDQAVYKSELYSDAAGSSSTVLGYNQRYSEYKYHDDEVHGLLADGQSLDSFVLQRGFNSTASLNSNLLEIPTNYMDDVMITTSNVSGFNAIVDCYFDAKYLRPLPEYSLPSLGGDVIRDGHYVDVPKGGTRL